MSEIHLFVLSAFATFIYVGLRAWQQLNVVQGRYWRVIPTSMGMGIGDVVLVLLIVKTDTLWIGVSNGVAAGLGCCLAMYINRRLSGKAVHNSKPAAAH